MNYQIVSHEQAQLGEGPMWHPKRQSLLWFDILSHRMFEARDGGTQSWAFDRAVSAAGWVSERQVLVATARDLTLFDLETGQQETIVALEADNPVTRSNDGRADPQGGFWIGTMGFQAEPGAGAFYRYYKGELRQLWDGATIPNATCFAPDGTRAYFADTAKAQIFTVALDEQGWPLGQPEVFLDVSDAGLNPDGAVVDSKGQLWNAQWGAGRVACYAPDGSFVRAVDLPASQTTCPAFGGPDLTQMFVTSAREGLDPVGAADGQTFVLSPGATGQAEHQVIL